MKSGGPAFVRLSQYREVILSMVEPLLQTEAFRQRILGKEHKHLFTCFRHPGVPPTNTQAEQSMRPVVLMRHVVHCTRSPKDLENHSVLRSLFETARRHGRKVHQFFYDLFTLNTEQAQAALYRNAPAPKPPARPGSIKQAIATGLSKARRAGVQLSLRRPNEVSQATRRRAQRKDAGGNKKPP